MFSLVKFHNEDMSIVKSRYVEEHLKDDCVVKWKGAKYAAFIISQKDDKSDLLQLQRKIEEQLPSLSTITNSNADKKRLNQKILKSKLPVDNNNRLASNKNVLIPNELDAKKAATDINDCQLSNAIKRSSKNKHSLNFTAESLSCQFIQPIDITNIQGSPVIKPPSPKEHMTTITKYANKNEILTKIKLPQNKNKFSNHSADESSFVNFNFTAINNFQHENSNKSSLPDVSSISNNNNINVSECSVNFESFKTQSSTYIDDNSASEYIPDSTSRASIDNLENSISFIDKTANDEVDNPPHVEEVVVPYSKTKSKKHFCVFCKTLQCKIGRHLCLKHKSEAEVKRALVFPKKSKERVNIINKLRKQGDFIHNTSANYNTGVLIVCRQQQKKCKNNVDDYVSCKKCKAFFSKTTLRIHLSKCIGSKKSRTNLIESRKLTRYVHSVANNILKNKIFPVLRNDEVTKAVRYDELIIKFGNKLTEKYSLEHQHDMIRANIRLIGRFMLELKKIDPDINELKDIFKPNLFDKCIKALRIVAHWDETLMWFKTPAVAQNLTSLIKKCGKKQRAELIKQEREDLKVELENFLLLWEEEIPTLINKKAIEDQTSQKLVKKVVLPSKEDIKILYHYLKENIIKAIAKLLNKFRMSSWIKLVEFTLIFIQIFNRRRAGEIERLTIENFVNKEVITDNVDNDILKNVSKESLTFAKQFVRLRLRGKLGRTVSVLLCPMSVKAIELILKYRAEAGITNENKYIFSRQTTSKLTKPYCRACPLLKKFSEECGAKIPESLRGTTLRKHIATHTSLLNIEEASVDRLANFMGHHKDIHKSIYRMSIPVAEITCVSKLLMAAVGDDDEVECENIEDNIDNLEDHIDNPENNIDGREFNIDDLKHTEGNSKSEETLFEDSKNSNSSSHRKRRSTSPFGKTKRCRWSNDEMEAVYEVFGNLHKLKKLPSLAECLRAIRQCPVLNQRTPQQMKSWIDNQRRYHME